MAAVATSPTVALTINGVELQVPKGELIVESVKRLGLEIPIFCYHPRMKPVGMCRMCLVEVGFKQPDGSVRMMPKPQAGCTLPASDGMVIVTDSEMVHRDRKGVLEFLLINHPLDCPICDRGGECPLQNNTLFYGPSTSRFIEMKRHLPKAYPLSEYVTLDLERCIQCGRCVRFTEEISGDAELAFRFRGASMQPSTFELREFQSKFSGNVIEICPVGALTSSKYRFRARPWDLQTQPGLCTQCSNGCSIWFDHRVGKMVRVNGRTNEAVNEEWTCDKGKFGHDWYNSPHRNEHVLARSEDALVESDWPSAYGSIAEAFKGGSGAILAGATLSNEAMYLLKQLATRWGVTDLDHRWTRHLPTEADALKPKMGLDNVSSTFQDLEAAPVLLVFGTSLADDLPMAHLRVRKAWFKNGARIIVAHSAPTETDSFASLLLRYKAGTEHLLAGALLAAAVDSGRATVPEATRKALAAYAVDEMAARCGVSAAAIREAASLVGPGAIVVTSHSLRNAEQAQDALESLAGLAMTLGASFNHFPTAANAAGAEAVGLVPGKGGRNSQAILEACAKGQIKSLWLADCDPFSVHPDRSLVERALETVEFLVVQGPLQTDATMYATWVLPSAAPAEQDGTYTNCEGRVQAMDRVIPTPGNAKPAWRICADLLLRDQPTKPHFGPGEVMAEMRQKLPAFRAEGV